VFRKIVIGVIAFVIAFGVIECVIALPAGLGKS